MIKRLGENHNRDFVLLLTDEICAVLKLDNSDAGQTGWKAGGSHCWNQAFFLDLDKV